MADSVSDESIAQFTAITGAPSRQAAQFLAASQGDIATAVASYYAAQEDSMSDNPADQDYEEPDQPSQEAQPEAQPSFGGGRRLGDGSADAAPATIASTSSSSKPKAKPARAGIATLGDYGASGRNHDDSDDDDKQDLFAGGEKSGLAVQNPDDLKKRILEKAQKAGLPPKEAPVKKSHFKGAARTLGGDDTPSEEVPAEPQPPAAAERVDRVLHFWRDGFSVDDGDLYRSDDPQNAELLNLIRQGRAPLRIMNVQPGQEVDVELKQHDENYVKPKKKYRPFEGSGNRLGSPTPGSIAMPGAFESQSAPISQLSAPSAPPKSDVDESQPTVSLRVSLASGTRLPARFNTTQTIGDVYDFVRRAETGGREFVLQTTFPTTELKDMAQVLGEIPEFKRGGVVVQKYI
jgi:UBX domain-containing protein 1